MPIQHVSKVLADNNKLSLDSLEIICIKCQLIMSVIISLDKA